MSSLATPGCLRTGSPAAAGADAVAPAEPPDRLLGHGRVREEHSGAPVARAPGSARLADRGRVDAARVDDALGVGRAARADRGARELAARGSAPRPRAPPRGAT